MRRKGGAPFSRRAIGVKADKEGAASAASMGAGDPVYASMQRGLSDGMNHIAQSIMNTGGRGGIMSVGGGGSGVALGMMDGDLVSSSTGELETPRRENIPLRPLMLNGSSANGGTTGRME